MMTWVATHVPHLTQFCPKPKQTTATWPPPRTCWAGTQASPWGRMGAGKMINIGREEGNPNCVVSVFILCFRKNNLAAKKSRDARRVRENQLRLRVLCLENANSVLREQMDRKDGEMVQLRWEGKKCMVNTYVDLWLPNSPLIILKSYQVQQN